ncbi:MAG: 4Fe-4S binding protein [Eubacteriaceae bacterium]
MNAINITNKKIKKKSIKNIPYIQNWSYVIIVLFFLLSFIDNRFGILGFICMLLPMIISINGHGKAHCSRLCPRGSFFGKIISKFSLNRSLPKFLRSNLTKNILLVFMFSSMTLMMIKAGWSFERISASLFRMMFVSFIVGMIMGIIFKPRSWCQVCPMGHAAGLIDKAIPKK